MKTQETILSRHSCREYKSEQISEEDLKIILDAANAAPVSMGNYSDVELVIIQNRELIDKIESAVSQAMPKIGEHPTYGAPTIVLVNGKLQEGYENIAYCNASCIIENIMISSTDLGLGTVYLMAVPAILSKLKEFYEVLNIEDGFAPIAAVAIGIPKEEIKISDKTTEKIKMRKFL